MIFSGNGSWAVPNPLIANSMPSSSAYAAPLSLDLEPSRFEYLTLAIGLAVAGLAIAAAALPLTVQIFGAFLAILLRAGVQLRARPTRLLLYSDGTLTASAPNHGAAALIPQPAGLVQAAWWGPIPHLVFALTEGPQHACALFPDRIDADSRQRLRVWMATHRPTRVAPAISETEARA